MIAASTAIVALQTCFSLALLCLLARLYRTHRVDLFRHEVFCLRAELFDLARKGDVAFDDPAYVSLRTMLNGFLRYAHRLGVISAILTARTAREMPPNSQVAWWSQEWAKAVEVLPPGVRAEVNGIYSRMHYALFKHLLLGSPIMVFTLVPVAAVAVIQHASRQWLWKLVERLYRTVESSFERFISRPLDVVAQRVGAA